MALNLMKVQEAADNAVELFENGNAFELIKELFEQALESGEVEADPRLIGQRLIDMVSTQMERKREQSGEVDCMDAYKIAREREGA